MVIILQATLADTHEFVKVDARRCVARSGAYALILSFVDWRVLLLESLEVLLTIAVTVSHSASRRGKQMHTNIVLLLWLG